MKINTPLLFPFPRRCVHTQITVKLSKLSDEFPSFSLSPLQNRRLVAPIGAIIAILF